MALEIEKLGSQVKEMAAGAAILEAERRRLLAIAIDKLERFATDWDKIEKCLDLAIAQATIKKLRAARPLDEREPLNAAIPAPHPPERAILIASDGSQILPDHHAAYLFSLINVGTIVYHHGSPEPPGQFTWPILDYPGKERGAETGPNSGFSDSSAIVNLRRDQAEIQTLAKNVWQHRGVEKPLVAILDQRLLYWPVSGNADSGATGQYILQAWQEAMTEMRHCDCLLAGYISRSRKQSVLRTLTALDIKEPGFDMNRLVTRDDNSGLTDDHLFRQFLGPGQRSKIFVDVSQHNDEFRARDPLNEVCFFYLNPGQRGQHIARVDIPMWVAQDRAAVDDVHSLLVDQCAILGDYPYVLARADEIAVVGRQDQESLSMMIENLMQRQGLAGEMTAKQRSKELARAGRTRHEP